MQEEVEIMGEGLRIKGAAKERGVTLSSLAKQLGIHRSNMSAMASGTRGVSLKVLKKISRILDCSIDELILPADMPVFKSQRMQFVLDEIQRRNYDGIDKTWVNRLMLAQVKHYKNAKRYK